MMRLLMQMSDLLVASKPILLEKFSPGDLA